jgi:hypothetical protein
VAEKTELNVSYGTDGAQKMDVYLRPTEAPQQPK